MEAAIVLRPSRGRSASSGSVGENRLRRKRCQVAGCSRGLAGQSVPNRAEEGSRSVSGQQRKEQSPKAVRTGRRSVPVTLRNARGHC